MGSLKEQLFPTKGWSGEHRSWVRLPIFYYSLLYTVYIVTYIRTFNMHVHIDLYTH
jgi:hypothetical protein